jgi:hypothetical protein
VVVEVEMELTNTLTAEAVVLVDFVVLSVQLAVAEVLNLHYL